MVKSENVDEYLKAIGVGWLKRTFTSPLGIEQVIKHEDNNFELVEKFSGDKQVAFKLVIGDASGVEYTNVEGKKETIAMNWEGRTLVSIVTSETGKAITKRTISRTKRSYGGYVILKAMILKTKSKGVTMTRIFKATECEYR